MADILPKYLYTHLTRQVSLEDHDLIVIFPLNWIFLVEL
jgi:hypothetical protein